MEKFEELSTGLTNDQIKIDEKLNIVSENFDTLSTQFENQQNLLYKAKNDVDPM